MTTGLRSAAEIGDDLTDNDEANEGFEEEVEGEVIDDDDEQPVQLSLIVGGPAPTQSVLTLKANKETAKAGPLQWNRNQRVSFSGTGEMVEVRFTKKGERIHVLEVNELIFD